MSETAGATPERIFQIVNAYQLSHALEAAVQLGLFTAIGEGFSTPAALAGRLEVSSRGVRILSDFLVVAGLLEKSQGEYRLGEDARQFLDARSPSYLGGTLEFLLAPGLIEGFQRLTEAVRKGGTACGSGTMEPEHPIWVRFARSMVPLMAPVAQFLAELVQLPADRETRVLDIAAGHGLFGITLAQKNPRAQIYALDWPQVLEVASENAQNGAVQSRYHLLPGSAFETDFGTGYDAVLATNFFHHFDADANTELMKKIRRSLRDNGQVATLEFVPDPDRVSPPQAAAFALTMLAGTPAGDAYPFEEYEQMFRRAGFSRNEIHEIPRSVHRAIISRP